MSTKEIVHDLLQKLPEDVSLHEVAREIEFVAAVQEGIRELDRGERIPIGKSRRNCRHGLSGSPLSFSSA